MKSLAGSFSERSLRALITLLLCVKLFATIFTTFVHKERVYDADYHAVRARSGGLEMNRMAYNPPLYYLPALPASTDQDRLRVLRVTNGIYVGLFYVLWLWVILPRLIPHRRGRIIASLMLLALPGYQKLAAMAHPDNLHAALSAVALAGWLLYRERIEKAEPELRWGPLLLLAAAIGLTGWTRPFAAATVAVLTAALLLSLYRAFKLSGRFFARAAVVVVLVGGLSSSWYMYRWAATGKLGPSYRPGFQQRFGQGRENFDHVRYFTTFYFGRILKNPRWMGGPQPREAPHVQNSFFTLLYSETWGDHWMFFSGRHRHDYKIWPKRVLFVVALPTTLLLLVGLYRGGRLAWRRRSRPPKTVIPLLVVATYALAATALYLYWQTHGGLTPGRNSAVKFIYNAHIYPLVIAMAAWAPLDRKTYSALVVYGLALFFAAFPIAYYWAV